jgi:hypothetical protein
MVASDMFLQDEIIYQDKTHQYFNKQGIEYTGVTKLLKSIQVPFDRQGVSLMMAKSIAEESGISTEQAQRELLADWDKTSNSSLDKGNYVHDGLEKYALTGKYEEDLAESVHYMQNIFKQYYRFYPEVLLHSHKYKTAGRTDLVLQRQKNKSPVLDFMDYKTNESKGIQFDSISRKDVVKHYNKYLLPPFDHLEACNYIIYSLQLSVYAFMAMDTLGIRVGKLAIIFFDNSFVPTYIPVPFMYHEAELLCQLNITRKELPYVPDYIRDHNIQTGWPTLDQFNKRDETDPIKLEMQRRQQPMTIKESFQIKDDWD